MIILTLKTSSETAEISIFSSSDFVDSKEWQAGRTLARGLPEAIDDLLTANNIKGVDGYAGYLGPGSFTGLRIGITTLNALAYVNNKPIVGALGEEWRDIAIKKLLAGENDKIIIPEYGSEAHITPQKK